MKPGVVLTATFGILCFVIPTNAQYRGCQKIRISGSVSLQTHLMTTYTITDRSLERRPIYTSDTTRDDRIYYVSNPYPQNAPIWFVGPYLEPGESGLLYVEDSSDYPNNIEGTFNIWDPETRELKNAPYVKISCADPGYLGCFWTNSIDIVQRIPMGSGITAESCIERCRNQGSSIAALNRQNCLCGSGVNGYSLSLSLCTTPCGGNSDQTCGGAGRADVYQTWVGVCGSREQIGVIYSPRYPGTYPPSENCTWEINFDPDKVIKFYYNEWNVPAGNRLVITDKSGQSMTLGPDFDTAWTNEVTVYFLSDSSRNGKFAIQYEAVDHCGGIGTTGGVAQISPSHGGNFAVGQQVTIRCTDGTETVVECLQDKIFNVAGPYCAGSTEGEMTTAKGTSPTVVIVVVTVLAVLVLLVVLCVTVYFVIKKRATHEPGASKHDHDMVDPGTADDEYEMIDRQDISSPARSTQQASRPPARSPQAPATVPPPPGVSGTQPDYQTLDPRTMCNTNSEYTSLTTNHTHVDNSDYEDDPEYEDTV